MLAGKMTVKEGAERLGLFERQVKRLKKRGKEEKRKRKWRYIYIA